MPFHRRSGAPDHPSVTTRSIVGGMPATPTTVPAREARSVAPSRARTVATSQNVRCVASSTRPRRSVLDDRLEQRHQAAQRREVRLAREPYDDGPSRSRTRCSRTVVRSGVASTGTCSSVCRELLARRSSDSAESSGRATVTLTWGSSSPSTAPR